MLLLDDRGWSASGPPSIWDRTSVGDIVHTTRMVVGPDEPFGGRSHEDMEADHWSHLTEILRQQGIVADALNCSGYRTMSWSVNGCLHASATPRATPSNPEV